MSRVGNKAIPVPKDVLLKIQEDGSVLISKGNDNHNYHLPSGISAEIVDSTLSLSASAKNDMSSLLGLHRSNINNLIAGMHQDFQVDLEINGVGYRAAMDNKYLTLWLGFSHCIKYRIPEYISFKIPKPTQISIFGSDKCYVNMIASDLCTLKKYDPYKKKGVYRKGQYLFTKEVSKK